jgi:Uma2 family endonuclease
VNTVEARVRRWKRLEYEQLIEQGLFAPDERLELIGGLLLVREPQGGRHAFAVELAADALRSAAGDTARVRVQLPLALGDDSQPEPDVSVVAGTLRDATGALPTTALLVVEVSESSLALDRTEKASLYARAGIPDYWIVNLIDRLVEVHRDPVPAPAAPFGWRYRSVRGLAAGAVVAPLIAPRARIPVDQLLR